ncbi:coiled-coil domain-containing protein [uncultured Methylobacterium sp.]|uniref:coiled-coil domain-containing protein n=1 Tax=uncultured Methylobacterium sp. TaxID=157278 RepID=UPI00258604B5|nr:coiled-coil domain-containing protein [uncultured Methylobacterium sp.]
MTAVAFDTYALVRRLKASGLSEDQAEAITGVLRDGRESDLASLATKADMQETAAALRADLREDISALKTDLRETEDRLDAKISDLSHTLADLSHRVDLGLAAGRADLKLLEQRMVVKLGTLAAAGVGILIAAIRYLPPAGH